MFTFLFFIQYSMEIGDTDQLDLSSMTVKWLQRQCELETTDWAATTVRCPIDLNVFVGVRISEEITSAILRILQKRSLDQYAAISFHLVRPDQQSKPREYATVQDVLSPDGADVVCVLFAASGDGVVRFVPSAVMGELIRVELQGAKCALYTCQIPYSLGSKAIYVHAKCSLSNTPYSPIYNVVRYACPYNMSVAIGEIRAYPKNSSPKVQLQCADVEECIGPLAILQVQSRH
jgi:hypothetical protein